MQYTKPMVDLVYEIRRRVDSAMKPSVKMANPDLLKELAIYHQHSKETITNALIKELLFMAGTEWAALLEPHSETHKEIPRQIVRVYRGQTILEEAPQHAEGSHDLHSELSVGDIAPPTKPVRLYRGHPIL